MDIGSIKVKGHQRNLDAYDKHEDGEEYELTRHFGVDSDDEEQNNTKHIFLS